MKHWMWGILIVMILAVCFLYGSKQHRFMKALEEANTSFEFENSYLESIQRIREKEVFMNGKLLKDSITVYDGKEKRTLSEVVDANKLVFVFSELNCDVCIQVQLENLKKMAETVGTEQIVLLINQFNSHYIRLLIRNMDLKFKCYRISDDIYKKLDVSEPFFFVLDRASMRMQSVFIPLKEKQELTWKYLETMYKYYFQ